MKKTDVQIREEMEKLKAELSNAEESRREAHERITGVDAKKFRIIDPFFIAVDVDSIEELSNVITKLSPFKNGWKITDGVHITSLYNIVIKNDYYTRKLEIVFENASGCEYWATIEMCKLPERFKETYFIEDVRGLYDSETVYVNMPSHYKRFRDIRVQNFSFPSSAQQVSFYGGDKVCRDEELIKEIIEDIKNWNN